MPAVFTKTPRSRSASAYKQAIRPKFIRIAGYWYPRGGMPIDVFWQAGKLPAGVWLPETGVSSYEAAAAGSEQALIASANVPNAATVVVRGAYRPTASVVAFEPRPGPPG